MKRNVSFYDYVRVRGTGTVDTYTSEEKQACWRSTEDIQRIRSQLLEDVASMEKTIKQAPVGSHNINCDEGDCSILGLEHFTQIRKQLRRHTRRATTDAVFYEQEEQWNRGIYDDESISRAYREAIPIRLVRVLSNSNYPPIPRYISNDRKK
jgi:hypothetical protein